MGTRDYLRKNGFRTAVIALSGGVDSSLVAAIAVDAVGARARTRLHDAVAHSSDHSVTDAEELASRLDIEITTIPIEAPTWPSARHWNTCSTANRRASRTRTCSRVFAVS